MSRTSAAAVSQGSFRLSVDGQEAGTSLRLEMSTDGGQTWATTGADQAHLPDGDYLFRAVVTDLAGNESLTAAQVVTVDTQPPSLQALQLRKVGEQGADALSALSSTGNVDLLLTLSPGVTALYQQSVDGGLTWTNIAPQVRGLAPGQYEFRAVLQDAAGNQTVLAEVPLTVDMTTPFAPRLDALASSGDAVNGYRSTTGTFQLGVSSLSPVEMSYEWRLVGASAWQLCYSSVSGALDGVYELRVVTKDAAGNRGYSNTITVEVDTRQPDAGTITLDDFKDSGRNALDRITADNSFTLVHLPDPQAGTAQSVSWEVSMKGSGYWQPTTAQQHDLMDGQYLFRAVVTDAAGNTHTTRTVDVNVDTRGPVSPRLALLDFDDTGALANDRISTDGSFSLSDSNVAADSLRLYEVSLDGGRTWLPTGAQQSLATGRYHFRVTATDEAGNRSISNVVDVTVDREAPAATQPQLKDFNDTGLAGDRITSDSDFTLGAPGLEAGASVRYWHSGDGGQTWTLTTAAQQGVADGQHWYRLEVTDLAGNTSLGPPLVVQVDTQAPDAGQLQLVGQGAGLDLQWLGADTDTTVRFEVSVDGGGQWLPVLAHTEVLAFGDYLFRAVVADTAGNTATTANVAWQVAEGTGDAGAATFSALLNDTGLMSLPSLPPPPPVL